MIKSIKKLSFRKFALVCSAILFPSIACENISDPSPDSKSGATMTILDITPIKEWMSRAEAETALKTFLKKDVFNEENLFQHSIIKEEYVRPTPGKTFLLITCEDGSQWVPNVDGLQRFIGALYLNKAIKYYDLRKWRAVETKFILHRPEEPFTIVIKKSQDTPLQNIFTINSAYFTTFSRYAGDLIPDMDTLYTEVSPIRKFTGYKDFAGGANVRIIPGVDKITLIDTEYTSFTTDDIVMPPSPAAEERLGGVEFTFSFASLLS